MFGALYPCVHACTGSCLEPPGAPSPAFESQSGVRAPTNHHLTAPPPSCNRHSGCQNRDDRRGFLPRGLFDTYPLVRATRNACVTRAGFEQTLTVAAGQTKSPSDRCWPQSSRLTSGNEPIHVMSRRVCSAALPLQERPAVGAMQPVADFLRRHGGTRLLWGS